MEVPFEEVGRGYELDSGKEVVLSDEELAAAAPRKTRTIDIEAFVDLADVDPSTSTIRTSCSPRATPRAPVAPTSCSSR